MSRPLVSFLMGVHNEEDSLPRALRDIRSQTYDPWELVVVDDASTDATREILERASKEEPRIRVIRNDANQGLTRSLNAGLFLARGVYVARRDPDDFHDADSLEHQVEELEKNPRVQAVSSDYFHISGSGETLRTVRVHAAPLITAWNLIFYNRLGIHSGVVFRAATAREMGGYDERFRYAQDFDFWQRLSLRGAIVVLPRFLARRTYGETGSISRDKAGEQEACACVMAARRMGELCGEKMELEEARVLREWWLGAPARSGLLPGMQARLKAFHDGLKAEQAGLAHSEKEWDELRRLVAKRWADTRGGWWCRWSARRLACEWKSMAGQGQA